MTLPPHCEVKPKAGNAYFTIFFLRVQGSSTKKMQPCHSATQAENLRCTQNIPFSWQMDALASSFDIIAKIQTVPGTMGREEFFLIMCQ